MGYSVGIESVTACTQCYFGGKKVGAKGDFSSRLVIVGESPGAMELAKGEPFVGPAGELLHSVLDPLLAGTNITPYITNAIQCLPRQKDPGKLSAAVTMCCGRLDAELRSHKRDVIIALGNAALWATTKNHNLKITQVRGQVFASPLATKGIVAAVHPAFLLRGGGNLQQWRRDFQMAISMLGVELKDTPTKMKAIGEFKPGKVILVESQSGVIQLANMLKDKEVIAGDIETDGFNPRTSLRVSPAEYEDKKCVVKEGVRCKGEGILSLGICFEKGSSYVIPGKLITDELFDNDAKWVWQNGKYDMGWLHDPQFNYPSARVDDDTMLLSYLLNENGGSHDLEQIGSDWLQAPNYKNMLDDHIPTTKHSYAYIPKDILYKYQGIDAELTFCLRQPMRDRVMADKHLSRVYTDILIPASKFIGQVETNGFKTDLQEVAKNEIILGDEAATYETEFQQLAEPYGFGSINIRSPKQIQEFLGGCLKVKEMNKSTDADQLERALQAYPPDSEQYGLCKVLSKYRKVHKLLSTYIIPAREKTDVTDGRMHTTFKLHGTTTGRLSSNKPNMQNIPRDKRIRGQFIAPEGRCLLEVDLAQAELRMLGQLSGDPILNAIFASGLSLHDEVAEYLFGKGFNKEQKMIAKNVNFGIVYGITAAGLLDQLEINAMQQGSTMHFTARDAQEWIDGWFKRFPVAAAFIQRLRGAPQLGQTLVSAFGRKRRFGVVSYDKIKNLMNEAANFPMQSGAHDITLLTGIELEPMLRTKYDCLVVNEVHDCLVNDLPNDMSIIIPVACKIIETMERIPREWGLTEVPFKAEAEIGRRWGNFIKFNPTEFNPEELKGVRYEEVIKKESH